MKVTVGCLVMALVLAGPLSGLALAEDRAAARQAFSEGSKYYDLNQYEEALQAFKLAYWNFEEPAILYNIAQCHRALKHNTEAVSFYRGYLRKTPGARNRDEVLKIITELESELARERMVAVGPPEGTIAGAIAPAPVAQTAAPEPSPAPLVAAAVAPTVAPVSAPPVSASMDKPRQKRRWVWGVVAGVVVAAGVAIGVGVGLGVEPHAPSANNAVRF